MDPAAEAFLREVADTARDCVAREHGDPGVYGVRADGTLVEIEPVAEDGFAVAVSVEDDAVVVTLGGAWARRFPREEDPDDDHDALGLAHDLVAAALWGRVRLTIEQLDGMPWRVTVCVGEPGRWLTFERKGGGLRAPWRRPVSIERRNRGRPSRPVDEVAVEPRPWAPWAGIRGDRGPEPAPLPMPVDGVLDLHSFSPKQVEPLVLETIEQHRRQGVLQLRIIHGKGIGNLRRTVHAILQRHPGVLSHRLGGHGAGSWGATLVELRPPSPEEGDDEAPIS
ncbi:Smr/MutS family protein [Paraliomyxa miuraensis]|uniref:Smr/MutS family protein n=1 Tax=Paraliomyxa miuraensis TaxID=376150 RepID=UPI00225112FD|nr:Smr/MutS family protein [Paraliomyxa miuraensis]MCX4241442.1 Smr/MutS family protein [Paraliomyxa miuraensis]